MITNESKKKMKIKKKNVPEITAARSFATDTADSSVAWTKLNLALLLTFNPKEGDGAGNGNFTKPTLGSGMDGPLSKPEEEQEIAGRTALSDTILIKIKMKRKKKKKAMIERDGEREARLTAKQETRIELQNDLIYIQCDRWEADVGRAVLERVAGFSYFPPFYDWNWFHL